MYICLDILRYCPFLQMYVYVCEEITANACWLYTRSDLSLLTLALMPMSPLPAGKVFGIRDSLYS